MRHLADEHEVQTAYQRRWHERKNGELLSLVESEFDVFLTTDQNLRHQQNLTQRPLRFIILMARSNKYESLVPLMPKVKAALDTTAPGGILEIA